MGMAWVAHERQGQAFLIFSSFSYPFSFSFYIYFFFFFLFSFLPFFFFFNFFFYLFSIFFEVAHGFGTERGRLVDAACRSASLLFFFIFFFRIPHLSLSFFLFPIFFFLFFLSCTRLRHKTCRTSRRGLSWRFASLVGSKNVPLTYWDLDYFSQNTHNFES